MAKELKPGERVTVNRETHLSSQSEAYKRGLQKINPGDIGEVVRPAEGRALTVKFNGIETVVSKRRLIRPKGESARKPAQPKTGKAKPIAATGSRAVAKPTAETKQPVADYPAQGASAQAIEEGALTLLNAVANKLLLRGGAQVDHDGVVELSLTDLPADVRKQLQALIDAKLAFNPRDLDKM